MSENLVQTYSIYINAPAQRVWEAITASEHTNRWATAATSSSTPARAGSSTT